MNLAVWISLATLLVGTVVTLSVAAMHRKQMRQIELHRADPRIPLIPPFHPVTRFLKGYGYFIVGFCFNLAMLIAQLRRTTPLTRGIVFDIVLATIGCFIMLIGGGVIYLFDRALESASRTWDVIEGMSDKLKELSERGKCCLICPLKVNSR
jgi:hypothetical protein